MLTQVGSKKSKKINNAKTTKKYVYLYHLQQQGFDQETQQLTNQVVSVVSPNWVKVAQILATTISILQSAIL